MHELVDEVSHFAGGLVADHLSEDCGADGTSDPVLVALETQEAALVEKVGAGEGDDVIFRLEYKFVVVGGRLFVLELADAALVVLWAFALECEFEGGEVRVRHVHVNLLVDFLLFLAEQLKQIFDLLVEFVFL